MVGRPETITAALRPSIPIRRGPPTIHQSTTPQLQLVHQPSMPLHRIRLPLLLPIILHRPNHLILVIQLTREQ